MKKLKQNYNYIGDEIRQYFGERVYKISLDAGCSCPNRDGTKGTKGCFYCGETGAHYIEAEKKLSITEQIQRAKAKFKRHNIHKFIVYFQSFTSTYGDIKYLEKVYEEALQGDDIVGFNICTRPDCFGDDVLDLLARIMKPRYHWLELGLESGHDLTLQKIGRGHDYQAFEEAYFRAKAKGLRICVHLILGLPGETEEMMLATVDKMNELQVDGIKFHNLYVVKNSVFEQMYRKDEIELMALYEYAELIGKVVSRLDPKIVIHRLAADAPGNILVAPSWAEKRGYALNSIEQYFQKHGVVQGKLIKHPNN